MLLWHVEWLPGMRQECSQERVTREITEESVFSAAAAGIYFNGPKNIHNAVYTGKTLLSGKHT